MSKLQRIWNVALGILLVAGAAVLAAYPDHDAALTFVCWMLFAILLAYGIKTLVYYLTMARHMVGGKRLLCVGIIVIDASLLVVSAVQEQYLAALYLGIAYVIIAVLNIVKAFDSRKAGGPWKWKMVQGVVSFGIANACIVNWQNAELLVILFAIGLVYEAFMRIGQALSRQAVIHIP